MRYDGDVSFSPTMPISSSAANTPATSAMRKDTQFIVVTHRKGTMERCDTLFGVAMEERGISSMVSVNLKDYQ